jgi:hypothetical protein
MGNFDEYNRDHNEHFEYVTSAYDNEKLLYEKMVAECINIHGVEMMYYVLTFDINYNKIWGEDNDRRFERCFSFMTLYELPREDNNFTQLSIEPFDVVMMTVSKKHFEQASKCDSNGYKQPQLTSYKPKIGDIIKSEYANYFYEIVDVSHEENMFLQSKHTWTFTCKPYKHEHHEIKESNLSFQQETSFDAGLFKNKLNGLF